MIFADLGADVIKVERPGYGDRTRGTGPFLGSRSSYFMSINRGKRSLALDIDTPEGRDIVLSMIENIDVVVENFRPGTMERLGLGYEIMAERNPQIIYASISGFGKTGPYSSYPALDIVIQAMSGMMSINGEAGRPPTRVGVSLGDLGASLFSVIGILSALSERTKSGKGQMLDLSMLDCQVALAENAFSRYMATGQIPEPLGSRHPAFTPFQAFPTADGYIVVAVIGGTNDQWDLFCYAINKMELVDDDRFTDGWLRTEHHAALEPLIIGVIQEHNTDYWVSHFRELGIPCSSVDNIAQARDNPQLKARGMFKDVEHKESGTVTMIDSPIRLSRTPGRIGGSAPELGEHTQTILEEILGITNDDFADLVAKGVVAVEE
jgi:CoA:oxalate CoA-transferase